MKKLLLVLLTSFSLFVNAQQWIPVSNGIGREMDAFAVYNGELVFGGWFSGSNPGNYIGTWNGNVYGTLGTGLSNGSGLAWVYSLCVYNGELYAGGYFTSANGIPVASLAKWNGLKWSNVGTGLSSGALVNCMTVYNNELYVGGLFSSAGGVSVSNIARWDGNSWNDVGGGTAAVDLVNTMTTHKNELYIAGALTVMGGTTNVSRIAKWNGTSWSALGTGNTFTGGNPLGIASNGTDLFLAGGFTQIGSTNVNYIAKWNGTTWSAMGNGADQKVVNLYSYNGDVYAGGDFYRMDGVAGTRHVARWDSTNSTWNAMHVGMDSTVYAFCVYNWGLYAGGFFHAASGTTANYIARWDAAIGIDEKNKYVDKVTLYPNPVSVNASINIPSSYGDLKNISIVLYDITGRAVQTILNPGSYNVTIDRTGLVSGLYFYQVSNGREILASDKFTVE